ncbi:hypothetical protein T4D_16978 [Trichinella pseudospiralis]|uniref:Uncharacterized protein n=1 Tax=Trichinella pseudospiralis TaxID=6337 RepID=A0A0V1FE21_TRIPS|nr:hypothetical protein T4D_16978 [Trichinella pseudospiralis]
MIFDPTQLSPFPARADNERIIADKSQCTFIIPFINAISAYLQFAFNLPLSIQELLWISVQQNYFTRYETSRQNDYDDMQHQKYYDENVKLLSFTEILVVTSIVFHHYMMQCLIPLAEYMSKIIIHRLVVYPKKMCSNNAFSENAEIVNTGVIVASLKVEIR